jgi:hypothetical protein
VTARAVHVAAVLLAAVVAAACGDDDPAAVDAGTPDAAGDGVAFPADYAASYVQVRACRKSSDHQLNYIRVLADPAALAPYQGRDMPFPEGAVVLKEEYEFDDEDCSGPIVQWSVMVKALAEIERLRWRWQRVTADRELEQLDDDDCVTCHSACGVAPEGYDGTCAVP